MGFQMRVAVERRRTDFSKEWQFHRVVFIVCGLIIFASAQGKSENNGCSSVKSAWSAKGFGGQMVPQSPIPGLYVLLSLVF